MQLRVLSFSSILLCNVSYTMEIIKKKLIKNKHTTTICYNPTIAKKLLINQQLFTQNKFSKGLIKLIQEYYRLLNDKDFKQSFAYIDMWNDFNIPISYHQLLTSTQIDMIGELFQYIPSSAICKRRLVMHYSLGSKEDYKEFLTLPINFRRYLTKMPQSGQNKLKELSCSNPDDTINKHKTINIIASRTNIKPELIIPEEKDHKK